MQEIDLSPVLMVRFRGNSEYRAKRAVKKTQNLEKD
jgi:hypothetical protein